MGFIQEIRTYFRQHKLALQKCEDDAFFSVEDMNFNKFLLQSAEVDKLLLVEDVTLIGKSGDALNYTNLLSN